LSHSSLWLFEASPCRAASRDQPSSPVQHEACASSWHKPSRPGEFHPEPLTEPAVTVSRRPARAAVRGSHLSSKYEGSSCCQLTQPRLGCPLPLLHGHYGRFITNTEQSAPARSIGTFCLAVFFPLEHFPFASSCRFPSSAQKPE